MSDLRFTACPDEEQLDELRDPNKEQLEYCKFIQDNPENCKYNQKIQKKQFYEHY